MRLGSSNALTRAAMSAADWARAVRRLSIALASGAACGFPLGSAAGSLDTMSAFSPAKLSSWMTVSRSARSASWTAPSTWGRARNGYGSWMPSAPGRSDRSSRPRSRARISRGDRRLAGPVSGRVNPGIKRDRIRGGRLERQCGDGQPRLEQRLDVDDDQCGVTDAHGVARDEREPVARSEASSGPARGAAIAGPASMSSSPCHT